MRLDLALGWLQGPSVVDDDGAVWSWENPAHPGFRYPEAAALVLGLLSVEGLAGELRARVAGRLTRDLDPDGGLGRGEDRYCFDVGVALSGLLTHALSGGALPDPGAPARLFGYLQRGLLARRPARGPGVDPRRWSGAYGSHLLKLSAGLSRYLDATGDPGADVLLRQLVGDLPRWFNGERFVVHSSSNETYLHGCCYALEGALVLARREPSLRGVVRSGAAWLARVQTREGGLRAWHDGARAWGPLRADATAQAVRLWSAVDRAGYEGAISKALGFLAGLQAPGGGLRYEPGSGDVNTWATVFAAQAVRWARGEGEGSWLL